MTKRVPDRNDSGDARQRLAAAEAAGAVHRAQLIEQMVAAGWDRAAARTMIEGAARATSRAALRADLPARARRIARALAARHLAARRSVPPPPTTRIVRRLGRPRARRAGRRGPRRSRDPGDPDPADLPRQPRDRWPSPAAMLRAVLGLEVAEVPA